jgi:hypothetical protein
MICAPAPRRALTTSRATSGSLDNEDDASIKTILAHRLSHAASVYGSDARSRHNRNLGALGQRHIVVGGNRVGEHMELELALAIGLQPDAGRALPPVTEADGDGVAWCKKADSGRQRAIP